MENNILSQTLHYLPILRVSCQKFGALEELEIAEIEAGCYGTGDQGGVVRGLAQTIL